MKKKLAAMEAVAEEPSAELKMELEALKVLNKYLE